MSDSPGNEAGVTYQGDASPHSGPIEPKGKKLGRSGLLRWLFSLFVILYVLLSYFHDPILTRLGRYLVVTHPPEKSDLIVCLAGGNVERGLAAADAYKKGLAPRIFMAREEPPDSYELLKEKGLNYPASVDLLLMILEGVGVPRSAFLTSDSPVNSTFVEAEAVRKLVKNNGYRSLIIITSPTHSKRAWLTYRKIFQEQEKNVRIQMHPSRYSKFKPEDWWKNRRYVREVIIEYEKLIYYALKEL